MPATKPRKKVELEMIVSVDQTGQQEMPGEIKAASVVEPGVERKNSAPLDTKIDPFGVRRSQCDSGAGETGYFRHTVINTAGTRHASSNRFSLVARRKISRSGSANEASVRH